VFEKLAASYEAMARDAEWLDPERGRRPAE
jgi:hypothetical protein